jgi:GAF domain
VPAGTPQQLPVGDRQAAEEFSTDDEELLKLLASLAVLGLAGPGSLDEPTALPPPPSPCSVVHLLAETGRRLVSADTATALRPSECEGLSIAAVPGQRSGGLDAPVSSTEVSISALAVKSGQAVTAPGAASDPDADPAAAVRRTGAMLAAPLLDGGEVRGVLTVGRTEGSSPFDDADVDILGELGAHAGLVLDLACTPPSGVAEMHTGGRGGPAACLDADLERRLVVYAATLHTLALHEKRSRGAHRVAAPAQPAVSASSPCCVDGVGGTGS